MSIFDILEEVTITEPGTGVVIPVHFIAWIVRDDENGEKGIHFRLALRKPDGSEIDLLVRTDPVMKSEHKRIRIRGDASIPVESDGRYLVVMSIEFDGERSVLDTLFDVSTLSHRQNSPTKTN